MLIQSIVFLAVPWVCLQFVNVVFPDHTHVLFLMEAGLVPKPYVVLEASQPLEDTVLSDYVGLVPRKNKRIFNCMHSPYINFLHH